MINNDKYLNTLLKEFEPLIHKVLIRIKVFPNNMNYEDFFQEFSIHLINIRNMFDGDPLASNDDRYKFTAYADNGLYWHGLNLLRKNDPESFYAVDENQLDYFIYEKSDLVNLLNTDLHIQDFLNQARKRLTYEDYLLLMFIVENNHSVEEIAQFLEITPSTIYQRKKRIQKRLEGIKGYLEVFT